MDEIEETRKIFASQKFLCIIRKYILSNTYQKTKTEELMKKMDYPNKPIEITDENFSETIQKYPLVVVDCWAQWCMPCKIIAPVIDELAKELSGKVVFGKLNIDQNRATSARFGIMSIPTLLIFNNGKLVGNMVGAVPKRHILAKLQPYLD